MAGETPYNAPESSFNQGNDPAACAELARTACYEAFLRVIPVPVEQASFYGARFVTAGADGATIDLMLSGGRDAETGSTYTTLDFGAGLQGATVEQARNFAETLRDVPGLQRVVLAALANADPGRRLSLFRAGVTFKDWHSSGLPGMSLVDVGGPYDGESTIDVGAFPPRMYQERADSLLSPQDIKTLQEMVRIAQPAAPVLSS